MSDPMQVFKDNLETDADGLMGGSRGDFMEALGEAVYASIEVGKPDSIVAAIRTIPPRRKIDQATANYNEAVGKVLGL